MVLRACLLCVHYDFVYYSMCCTKVNLIEYFTLKTKIFYIMGIPGCKTELPYLVYLAWNSSST